MSSSVPTCDLRRSIGRIRPILGLLLLVGGCAGHDVMGACDEGNCEGADGGAAPGDAGPMFVDAGAVSDAGLSPTDTPPGFSERGGVDPDLSCSDGLDNDDTGSADCDDQLSCGASDYCCFGSTNDACCDEQPAMSVLFSDCTDLDNCAGLSNSFGANAPVVESGYFVPNGDGQDSGVVLGDPVDGRTDRIELRVDVEAPSGTCDCADAVAFGIGAAPAGQARAALDVAVMVRHAYGDIALVVAGEVVWTHDLSGYSVADTGMHELPLELDLNPDGTLTLRLTATPERAGVQTTAAWTPRPDRRVLLYGRTPNRAAMPMHTRIASAAMISYRCEVPSALARSATPASVSGAQPSIVRHGSTLWMATASDGQIAFHNQQSGAWVSVASTTLDQEGDLSNPALTVENERLVMYVEETTATRSAILRYEQNAEGVWGVPTPVGLSRADWGQPSALTTTTDRWLAVTNYDNGEISLFRWNDVEETYLLVDTLGPSGDHADFRQDEVADPELVEDGAGLLRLYYAGRRGTRWAIGVQISTNGTVWRDPVGEAILSSTGQGHDALGVRSPAVLIEDGEVTLYHTASDGIDWSVGLADGTAR
ncbi:MAG: hypothetical protein AB8I08_15100 [Sandaracinaceae bacterium]